MSRAAIRQALEGHLTTLTPAWPTKWENVTFSEPTTRTPWQSAALLFGDTRATGIFAPGAGEEWRGIFHVTLFTPAGTGSRAVDDRAAVLRGDLAAGIEGHFYRGLVLTSGNAAVTILQPYERAPIIEAKWYGLPVLIPFQSFFG